MNKSALNIACVIRWKKASDGKDRAIAPIITPSCLNVDSAIIFFMSYSNRADMPAINIVVVAMIKSISLRLCAVCNEG